MSDTTKLKRKDVKKEVKRIKKLSQDQREEQFKVLRKRVIDEIHSTCARLNNYPYMGEEQRRLLYCVRAFPKDYRKSLFDIYDEAFSKVVKLEVSDGVSNLKKVNTTHVSGLPLLEHTKVTVWWREDKLIFASAAKEFSLPVERVMGMATSTTEFTSSDLGGSKTYFTIEYIKDDELKAIVVWVTYKSQVKLLIRHFDEIKGSREIIKEEL